MSTTSLSKTSRPLSIHLPAWGVYVIESHHAHDFRMDWTENPFLKVLYFLSGRARYCTPGERTPCNEGDIVVVPPNQTHHLEDEPHHPVSLYALCIEARVWTGIDPHLDRRLTEGVIDTNKLLSDQIRDLLRRLLFEQTAARSNCAITMAGLTLQTLGMLAPEKPERRPRPTSKLLTAVASYVEDLDHRFYEAATIDQVAERLGLSRRRFTQLFRQITGTTWLTYVRRRRLEYAKRLLRDTDRTIASIVFECGFGDVSSFYRAFRSSEGTSPSRWRADLQ